MLEGNSVLLETLEVLVKTSDGEKLVKVIGNDQRETVNHVVLSDIFASIS